MIAKLLVKSLVVIVAALVNIFAITIITVGVDALPIYFMATFLNWVAGILIGWDF